MNLNLKQNTQAQLLALLAVLFWSSIASAFKLTLRHLSVSQLLFYASLTSLCLLLMIVVVQKKWPLITQLPRRKIAIILGLGLLNPLIYYCLLLSAYDQLPAQMAQSINYLWGIVLSILAVPLLGHKLHKGDILALALGLVGVVIIASGGDLAGFQFKGSGAIMLALSSTVIFALYWIIATKQDIDSAVLLFLAFSVATPCALVLMLLDTGWQAPSITGLLGAVYLGVFEMGLTFLLWLKALKLTDNAAKISMLIYLSPLLSFVFIHNIVGEDIYWTTLVGFGLIILGLIVQKVLTKE